MEFAKKIVYMGHLFTLEKIEDDTAEYKADEGQDCIEKVSFTENIYKYFEHTNILERR